MTFVQEIYYRYKRHRSLQSDHISALPILILMPHSACNCRCVMCDIWKGNRNLKQLTEKDIRGLLGSLKKLETRKLVMSGGEALLNPHFFRFCEILKDQGIRISLLSTGLLLERHAEELLRYVNDIIVSLDGDEELHDRIRNTPGAFNKMKSGIHFLKKAKPGYQITARTVIQKQNFASWPRVIDTARSLGVDRISFLPADSTSQAFNRETVWDEGRRNEILPGADELDLLEHTVEQIISEYKSDFQNGFIAENPEKIRAVYRYYAAFYSRNPFPYKKCNAPWVSAVVEADGSVRPCFFHPVMGNIKEDSLEDIINSEQGVRFRKNLDMQADPTCTRCVCYLNLRPGSIPQ